MQQNIPKRGVPPVTILEFLDQGQGHLYKGPSELSF